MLLGAGLTLHELEQLTFYLDLSHGRRNSK